MSDLENKTLPKATPIYDDPNHKHYGICRRLHLILMYLYPGNALAEQEERFEESDDNPEHWHWTELVSYWASANVEESLIARSILQRFWTAR